MVVRALDAADVDRLFHALSDATRRDIVERAMHGEHSVSALARRYDMSFAAVQKHVAVLTTAGLVTKERRGREQLVRSSITAIRDVRALLDAYEELWRGRIDAIGDLLTEQAHDHPKTRSGGDHAAQKEHRS